jgi:hypothetical protein
MSIKVLISCLFLLVLLGLTAAPTGSCCGGAPITNIDVTR